VSLPFPEPTAAVPSRAAACLALHVDLDVVDPAEVPGLRYPAPHGASSAQVAGALHTLLGTGRVAAVGIACTWHPGHSAAAHISSEGLPPTLLSALSILPDRRSVVPKAGVRVAHVVPLEALA